MNEMTLTAQLEGLLFYLGKSVKKADLLVIFGLEEGELQTALLELRAQLQHRGLVLIENATTIELATDPRLDPVIDSLRTEELSRDIGKAGAETLAIILYRGPITRGDIEQIRGVNCQHIIRNLLIRDLIEKDSTKKTPHYIGTTNLLAHLGIEKREDLPNFSDTMNALDVFETALEQTL